MTIDNYTILYNPDKCDFIAWNGPDKNGVITPANLEEPKTKKTTRKTSAKKSTTKKTTKKTSKKASAK